MGLLDNKIALITAAAQGIGRAAAIRFAAEGCKVIATDINLEILNELKDIEGISVRQLDVTDKVAIFSLADQVDKIDILFNCAGFVHQGTIFECSEADWDKSFDTNVKGMFWMCKAFLPKMIDQGHGVILNMSSIASHVIGANNRLVYNATKAAVIGMSKALATDFVEHGVRVVCLCPGAVDTPSLRDRKNIFPDPEAEYRRFMLMQPMKRYGTPEEIASAASFLVSDEASSFITGTHLVIDGCFTNT